MKNLDILYVLKGNLALSEAKERILATTQTEEVAKDHLQHLHYDGYYARIEKYYPAGSTLSTSFRCSKHAAEDDSSIICKTCSKEARWVRFELVDEGTPLEEEIQTAVQVLRNADMLEEAERLIEYHDEQ